MSAQKLITNHLDLWTGAVTHKSSRGRGSNGKIELTGIKKLRELILELAVRGMLVEQDPNDEPASVLLERIAEEKARLVKEGKIKKPKKLPEITEEEKPFKLPDGWAWIKLGNLGVISSSSRVHQKDWQEKGIPFYRAREIVQLAKNGDVDNDLFISEKLYNSLTETGFVPEPGDFMITGVGTIGVSHVVKEGERFHFKDASVLILKNTSRIYPFYLHNFFRSKTWIGAIHANSMGTTVHTLTIARASETIVPFPPLIEQQRIVDKVDELMALCDHLEQQVGDQLEAHEVLVDTLLDALTRSADATEVAENWVRIAEHFDTLFTTEGSIDKLKQTILQLAVMGRLVEQDPNDEPASVLLERITEEKARLVKEGSIRKFKSLPEIKEDQKYFPLPVSWQWVMLGKIQTFTNGFAFKSNDFSEHGVGVIRIGDVSRDGRVTPSDMKFIPEEIARTVDKQFFVKPGELVITMTGDVKPGVNRSENVYLLNQRVGKVTPHIISRDFLYIYLKTVAKEKIDNAFGGVIPNVSTKEMNESVIGLPPLKEQHRIVEKVDELMTLCDQLKARLGEAGETRVQLAEAVVEQSVP